MRHELPDDLNRLGVYLEVAAGETLRRRDDAHPGLEVADEYSLT